MKKLIASIIIAVSLICFSGSVSAASPDEAVMISQQDGLTPLYTTAPDSSLKDHSNRMSREQGILFYTQTTALALIAGYLILFKVKGIPHGEKMHRRRRKDG
ncbi:MAG: hypothetical protein IIV96_01635 [Ruminococcus sp.]|nr:hypothetical protein [uncultured Ruminococcus sp.]MBQ2428869.1 hypothetical protein [Ruminococcus sp.]MBQ3300305.1 hypothetical protein [Ruminococcus sp.]MBQ5763322.1 hypothetical protein [Ruminococcus sp.]